MSGPRRALEWVALGGCAFLLTQALLPMFLGPGDTLTDGNPTWRMVLTVSYLSVAAISAAYYRETLFLVRRNWFLAALVALALASCLWAEMPDLVFRRSIALLGTTIFGFALAVRLTVEEQLRLLSWVFRIIAVLSLACIIFVPSYGISSGIEQQGEWQGVFGHKNVLGSAMALSVLVEWQLPTYTRHSQVLNRLALLLSAVLLFFSASVTPMVALVGSILFIKIYDAARRRLGSSGLAVVLASSLVIALGLTMFSVNTEGFTAALGRSSDLTGRTAIWSRVISYIPRRPILGYGYSGFWQGASSDSLEVDRTVGTRIMYSHNGYLEILLALGSVGLLFVLIFLWTGWRRAVCCSERGQPCAHLWPLIFLVFFLLHNFGECTILVWQNLEWALCVAIVAGSDPAILTAMEPEDELPLVASEEFT
ncbi:MAG TPA: O-antigen ligase family protein [Candidatus Cybelea sp.]|nr:O-antigen ligase family protein [Candidatus Cybelea sp.]